MLRCHTCRKEIRITDRFCPYCGTENAAYEPRCEEMEKFISSHLGVILAGGCAIIIVLLICVFSMVRKDPLDKYVDLAHYVETNTKTLTAEEMGVAEDYFEEKTEPSKPMKIWQPTVKVTPKPTVTPTPVPILTKEEMDKLTLPILGKN